MAELFHATRDGSQLICGCCGWLMQTPKVLVQHDHEQLVECQHCFRLNKVKKQ